MPARARCRRHRAAALRRPHRRETSECGGTNLLSPGVKTAEQRLVVCVTRACPVACSVCLSRFLACLSGETSYYVWLPGFFYRADWALSLRAREGHGRRLPAAALPRPLPAPLTAECPVRPGLRTRVGVVVGAAPPAVGGVVASRGSCLLPAERKRSLRPGFGVPPVMGFTVRARGWVDLLAEGRDRLRAKGLGCL